MINVENLDRGGPGIHWGDEKHLLEHDAENVRAFYSLTGPARKEYTIQMAEAEAERIRIVRQAQADGIVAIRKAEAEGYRLIGDALAQIKDKDLVMKLASLVATQEVAHSMANGQATKVFVPQGLGDLFSLLGVSKDVSEAATPHPRPPVAHRGPTVLAKGPKP